MGEAHAGGGGDGCQTDDDDDDDALYDRGAGRSGPSAGRRWRRVITARAARATGRPSAGRRRPPTRTACDLWRQRAEPGVGTALRNTVKGRSSPPHPPPFDWPRNCVILNRF